MAEVKEKPRELRVVMFPWLAHGHMTPFLELARNLVAHNLKVFFVSTPLNIQRLRPLINYTSAVELVELAMPAVEGLPAGVESTSEAARGGRGATLIPLLFRAVDLLEKPFEELLRQLSPDLVIHESSWVPRVTAKLAIRAVFFLILGMAAFSFSEGQLDGAQENPTANDLAATPPGFPSRNIRRRLFEAREAMGLYGKQAEGRGIAEKISAAGRESWAVACNTCVQVEGKYVEYLQALWKRPVHPVGFLMPSLPPPPVDDICMDWLDGRPAASVVLVSFGSECVLPAGEVAAMAMGLQESGAAFIWVLPSQHGLPQGFQDDVRGQGLLVTKWAPQLHILNHHSTGAFLTHCGWNSITEGLRFGVPLIALPMQFDQGLNAKLVQELNVGLEVGRDEESGAFTKDDINKAIKVIMQEEGGKHVKFNVNKISTMLADNNFEVCKRNIASFVSTLRTYD